MRFDVGDLVDYRPVQDAPVFTGVILDKMWEEQHGSIWIYKIYFISEEDEAWCCENDIRLYGGFNGI